MFAFMVTLILVTATTFIVIKIIIIITRNVNRSFILRILLKLAKSSHHKDYYYNY